jgi:hypothetical protein
MMYVLLDAMNPILLRDALRQDARVAPVVLVKLEPGLRQNVLRAFLKPADVAEKAEALRR